MNLTPHFTVAELTTVGDHAGIDNDPDSRDLVNLKKVAMKLEEARQILAAYFGREVPIGIKYALRREPLNKAVGGSETSAHLEGLAADTYYRDGVTPEEVFEALRAHPTFMEEIDQLIIERGCLHLGLPCRASGYMPRHELRGESWIGEVRHYPLLGVWKPRAQWAGA